MSFNFPIIRRLVVFFAFLIFQVHSNGAFAKTNTIDKNTKIYDSKGLELSNRQYDCQICFTFQIDSKISRQDVYIRFALIAKHVEYIDVNGNMLAGIKGDPRVEVEPCKFKKAQINNYHSMKVWYPIEDPDEFFECTKIRLQTKTGNLDIELSHSQMKELRAYYEKASETVTSIFKTKTDITYGF